ncbi:LacI family DNA-binding transcriptional regulator [Lentzea flava]|uniref:LacI family transcriptional regulator n=1 Tax=Lentzea flava TaxID=103732 RepID=A0ABQ2UM77_9PSEU|nr:LacI family DNA-binding transcriptional regulator [Lentzea flava]MCP2200524.1 transcriptional regulator, LacI family [Lentzea flava]GGU41959.1 LacI family transcriptional regulator [Lentzea flava]
MKRPTIKDIAAAAGVSKGAVSLALNGRSGVSEATRARVLSVASSLGYRPSVTARALSSASADAVGLVLVRPPRALGDEAFFFQLIAGMQSEMSAALLLQVVSSREEEIELYRRWWAEHRVDGVFLVDLLVSDPRVSLMSDLGLPAVVVGGSGHHGSLASVWADDYAAMTSVVEYLKSLGHRRIARVAGLPSLLHTVRRDQAFLASVVDGVIVAGDYTAEAGAAATRELLGSEEPPTAIVYDNDVMAVAGAEVAGALGVAVPSQLSIVAWDDSVLCQHGRLTALSRDTFAFGARAARALLAVLEGASPTDVEDVLPALVVRGSTAALGGASVS